MAHRRTFVYTHQLMDRDGMMCEEVMADAGSFVDHYTWYAGGRSISTKDLLELEWTAQPLETPRPCKCKACGGEGQTRKTQQSKDDQEWQREFAMQQGMGLGVDAYNEAMGWEVDE